ncbi:MAG: 4-(cytidine 5'-diphospho)-2-C-methyl-D-erythritol kinase [Minwuiales bacterium]|nr:4-(cytidine 5'-diphospho)-2-C-methyl-D-erythritol kinase [Minwuiales bacterium]
MLRNIPAASALDRGTEFLLDERGERRFAPAKINLYLHVTGRRPDGYHLLDSLVVFADVGDSIVAEPADDLTLSVDGDFSDSLVAEPDNLVLKAAERLRAAATVERGARLRLTKNLPVAAGLGGGSADAAAALHALAALWDLSEESVVASDLAVGLGADVPVCLAGRPARMLGIGEVLRPPPPLPPFHLVLVNPGLPLSTAAVFARLADEGGYRSAAAAPPPAVKRFDKAVDLASALATCGNDLEEPARTMMPEVGKVLDAIAASPDCLLARMSGSGPTCFGLFASETAAAAGAISLGRVSDRWWVRAAPVWEAGT